jgi:hypothetical protein
MSRGGIAFELSVAKATDFPSVKKYGVEEPADRGVRRSSSSKWKWQFKRTSALADPKRRAAPLFAKTHEVGSDVVSLIRGDRKIGHTSVGTLEPRQNLALCHEFRARDCLEWRSIDIGRNYLACLNGMTL